MNGRAVHAVGGQRDHYQPIQSVLHASSEPIPLARALRDSLGFQTLYLADLDAIAGCPPRLDLYQKIIDSGFDLWIDAGVRDARSLAPLLELGRNAITIIAGLETVQGPRELADIVHDAGAGRVVFSLDLFAGRPRLAVSAAWGTEDPLALAEAAIDCGVRGLLILDLARVGTGKGLGTNELMGRIRSASRRFLSSSGVASLESKRSSLYWTAARRACLLARRFTTDESG